MLYNIVKHHQTEIDFNDFVLHISINKDLSLCYYLNLSMFALTKSNFNLFRKRKRTPNTNKYLNKPRPPAIINGVS